MLNLWFLSNSIALFFFFFFQAEDGIRDSSVTGVQTCALPIGDFRGLNSEPAGRVGQQGDLVQAKSQTLNGCLRFRFRGSGGVGPRLRRQGLQTHSYHRDSDSSSIFEGHSARPPRRESVHQAASAINGPVVAAIAAANRGYKAGSTNSAKIAELTKPPRITTAAG